MFVLRKMFIDGKYKNRKKWTGLKDDEFIDYLTVALKNLGFTKAGVFNVEGEVKRLLKTYSVEEIKSKLAQMK